MALVNGLKKLNGCLKNVKINYASKKLMENDTAAISVHRSELIGMGVELFGEFYNVGYEASKLKIYSFKDTKDQEIVGLVKNTTDLIIDISDWIRRFLCSYPDVCIVIDKYEYIDARTCSFRSGVQFMFDLFVGLNDVLDKKFQCLYDETMSDIDEKLRDAKKYTEFRVRKEDIPDYVPQTHTWWF
jgi:hypothetical protein